MRFWSLDPLIVASRLIARDPTQLSCQLARRRKARQSMEFSGWFSESAGLRRIVKLRLFARILRTCPRRPPAPRVCDWSGADAMKPPLPENEAERLNALRRYQILDTPPEPAFDRIAEMAANFFHVPMAGLSLVDEDRVWFKSRLGIEASQTARDAGLCSTAMLSQGVFHLRDAADDQRATAHSLVHDLGIRFYAGA